MNVPSSLLSVSKARKPFALRAPSPNLFFHVTELNGQRVKHGDRVSFQTAPDKRNPAKFCAVAVQVGGATVEFEPRVDRQGRPCAKTVKLIAE